MKERKFKSKYPFRCLTRYIPTRYTNLEPWQEKNRQLIYDFKEGTCEEKYYLKMAYVIKDIIKDETSEWVVVLMPASYKPSTDERWSWVTKTFQEKLGVPVSMEAVRNREDMINSVHITKERKQLDVIIDKNFVKDKKIILIDDVITTGRTFRETGDLLVKAGAKSIFGVIFAMTIHPNLPIKPKELYKDGKENWCFLSGCTTEELETLIIDDETLINQFI